MSIDFIHPLPFLLGGALLLPFLRRSSHLSACQALAPLLALAAVLANAGLGGQYAVMPWMDWQLVFGSVDRTATLFALALTIPLTLAGLYALGATRKAEAAAAWASVAGALGVVYSGDWLSLFGFWTMMSLAPAFIIWSGTDSGAGCAGFRHALPRFVGTVALLVGILLRYRATGDLAVVSLGAEHATPATCLILAGLVVAAAAFPLHFWLPETCVATSPLGTIAAIVCIPAALHVSLRCGEGMGVLVAIGLVGALYGLFQSLRASDLRRLKAWALMTQGSFALAAIGCGGELARGVALHVLAFCLAFCLLAMTTGAMRQATGFVRLDELGGVFTRMPSVCIMAVAACLALAAAPILGASALLPVSGGLVTGWPSLFAALTPSLAVFCALLTSIRMLFPLFFGKKGIAAHVSCPRPISLVMRLGMGLTAGLCVLTVTAPAASPFSAARMLPGLKLFGLAAFAFVLLRPMLNPQHAEPPDIDWLFRRCGPFVWRAIRHVSTSCEREITGYFERAAHLCCRMARTWRNLEREWLAGAGEILADAFLRTLGGRLRRFQDGSIRQGIVQALLPAALLAMALLLHH